MVTSFNDFIHKYGLKNDATSTTKIQQLFSSLYLNDVKVCLGDGPFSGDVEIVNLHPSKGTHSVAHINQNYFDSFGCSPPQKLSRLITKRFVTCLFSENKIQSLTSRKNFFVQFIVYI